MASCTASNGKTRGIQRIANSLARKGVDQSRGIAQKQYAISITFSTGASHREIPSHRVFCWTRIFEPMGIRRAVDYFIQRLLSNPHVAFFNTS